MKETLTPRRTNDLRRSILINTATVVSSPLRKSNVGISNNNTPLLEPVNDEEERSKRRSMVAMQRRLTNINSSSLNDTGPVMEESQIKDHLKICAKLFTENRISAKNAWQLHVIDVMNRISSKATGKVLQVSSSLDVGAKIYGLRIDDTYVKGYQLTSTIVTNKESKKSENKGGDEMDGNISINQEQRRRNVRKKNKRMAEDKRNTIDKDEKTVYSSIKHIESVVFGTKENIDISATDNLFTQKLPTNPANHQLMLLSEQKYWSNDPDIILDNRDRLLDIDIPHLTHFNVCVPFKDFETGNWDPEEEEKMLSEASNIPEAVLDENGIPIAELDGSIHDIFEENHDIIEDHISDVEEQHEVFQAQIHGEIAHIVDAIPEENRVETDYGYNTLVRTTTGKFIDKIWAGPSHWKVKFNRRSSARYSGTTVTQVAKHTKKVKQPQMIDFSTFGPDILETVGKFVSKRTPPTVSFEKITLPVPDASLENFDILIDHLLTKPVLARRKLIGEPRASREYEVQVYNYENPNDSQYCSQNNSICANDEPLSHSFEEVASAAAQQQFIDENLVDAPEMVTTTHIPYAMQAKKIDMKKLKSAIWKCITNSSGNAENTNRFSVKPTLFSNLYQMLPQFLTTEIKKELTCPLALVALLHLCNENNLELRHGKNFKDFTITLGEK